MPARRGDTRLTDEDIRVGDDGVRQCRLDTNRPQQAQDCEAGEANSPPFATHTFFHLVLPPLLVTFIRLPRELFQNLAEPVLLWLINNSSSDSLSSATSVPQ